MTRDIASRLAEALSHTDYDQITWMGQEFEGWSAGLAPESGDCLCGDKPGCFCCDPISITAEVAWYLATTHPDQFTVTNPHQAPESSAGYT